MHWSACVELTRIALWTQHHLNRKVNVRVLCHFHSVLVLFTFIAIASNMTLLCVNWSVQRLNCATQVNTKVKWEFQLPSANFTPVEKKKGKKKNGQTDLTETTEKRVENNWLFFFFRNLKFVGCRRQCIGFRIYLRWVNTLNSSFIGKARKQEERRKKKKRKIRTHHKWLYIVINYEEHGTFYFTCFNESKRMHAPCIS